MLAHVSPLLQISYDEAGSGPPLVLLHAFPQARGMWSRQLDALPARFRVLCPDLPGFGQSRSASTCSIESMADDVAAWLKYLQSGTATVGGVSMGGYVALALARRHPRLLRGLILSDTRADADSAEARVARSAMIELAQRGGAPSVFEKMAPRLFAGSTREQRPEIIDEAARIAAPIERGTIVSTLEALRDRPDARSELREIGVPTLILVGAEDEVSPLDSARALEHEIPDATLQVLAGAGHFAHAEAGPAWNQAVLDWARREAL